MVKKGAARSDEIATDSFSQMVMPSLQQQAWQQRELKWEARLTNEPARIEKIPVYVTINILESFLVRLSCNASLFAKIAWDTSAKARQNRPRCIASLRLIQRDILIIDTEQKDALFDQIAEALSEKANEG